MWMGLWERWYRGITKSLLYCGGGTYSWIALWVLVQTYFWGVLGGEKGWDRIGWDGKIGVGAGVGMVLGGMVWLGGREFGRERVWEGD